MTTANTSRPISKPFTRPIPEQRSRFLERPDEPLLVGVGDLAQLGVREWAVGSVDSVHPRDLPCKVASQHGSWTGRGGPIT